MKVSNGSLSCIILFSIVISMGCASSSSGDAEAPNGGDAEASSETPPAGWETVELTPQGLKMWTEDMERYVWLLPAVWTKKGKLGGFGTDLFCNVTASRLSCPVADRGELFVETTAPELVFGFNAAGDETVEALALEGVAQLPGAKSWMSNGFQSWSQSGMIALQDKPEDEILWETVELHGDNESMREGRDLSWWYSFTGAGGVHFFAGALTGNRFKPWVAFYKKTETSLGVMLGCGGAGESIVLKADESVTGERWFLGLGNDLAALQTDYAGLLPSRRLEQNARAEAGWNSWYELWNTVDAEAVQANADLAGEALADYSSETGSLRIVIDDGWQKKWGEWEPNEKFPDGMAAVAEDLDAKGFTAGIWLAPFLVQKDSDLIAEHTDWYVKEIDPIDGKAKPIQWMHQGLGAMQILDPTNPAVEAHLSEVISRVVGWGYGLLKIDFLFAATFEGIRVEDVTGMEAFHRGMAIIRNAAGDDAALLAVGAPAIASFPYAESWRIGTDIAYEPLGISWLFMNNQLRSISSRWFLCRSVLCDPDPLLLRELSQEEISYGSWVVTLAGGGLFLSDDLRQLDASRQPWGLDTLRVGLTLSGQPARPENPYPDDPPEVLVNHVYDFAVNANNHVVPGTWVLPDGQRLRMNLDGDNEEVVEGVTIPARGARLLTP